MSSAKGPILVALVANFLIAVLKFAAAFITRSSAMLAEAYHSLSDTLNQIFLLIGLRRSKLPADEMHPFGPGKSAYFWSFVVAVFIFGIAGTLSVIEGIEGLRHPHTPKASEAKWAFGVLGFAVLFEGYALRTAIKAVRKASVGMSIRAAIARTKDAALLTIIFEDTLALVGLVVAGGGLGLSLATADGRYDAAASLVIGLMLMGFALVLANRNRRLLIGEAVNPDEARDINAAIIADPAVDAVLSLKTMHLNADDVLVAVDVHFANDMTTDELEAAVDRIETAIQKVVPAAKHVYIEAEGPGTGPFSQLS